MVNKNSSAEVEAATLKISNLSKDISKHTASTPRSPAAKKVITELVEKALTEVCTLKGVGPATGSLVLSVYVPRIVPFFGDELFNWVVGDKGKLKYDRKEYALLLEKNLDVVLGERLGQEIGASELEKIGYVMGHLDVLESDEIKQLEEVEEKQGQNESKADLDALDGKKEEEGSQKNGTADKLTLVPKEVTKKKRPRKQDEHETVPDASGTRRSKRARK